MPYPIIDKVGQIVAVLAGQPGGDYSEQLLHLKNYLKTRQSQVCLGTLKDAQEFGQFLGNTRLPKHPG